ncbi:hypothetical protein TNCV_162121 [Trichonephila clavipes]|nr:hypothetical protein TNCV_162121 [Trichonephila clavipes]
MADYMDKKHLQLKLSIKTCRRTFNKNVLHFSFNSIASIGFMAMYCKIDRCLADTLKIEDCIRAKSGKRFPVNPDKWIRTVQQGHMKVTDAITQLP